MKWLQTMIVVLSVVFTLSTALVESHPAQAGSGIIIPIKVGIIVDQSSQQSSTDSAIFQSVQRVLKANGIPWEALDISKGQHYSLIDGSGNPLYSTILINVPGTSIDAQNADAITNVVGMGAGAIGLLPNYVNPQLASIFGITTIGLSWKTSEGIFVERDEFTFAYAGQTLKAPGMLLLNHSISSSALVVAHDTVQGLPTIWVYHYGSGKTVFFNNNAVGSLYFQGILLQSILYSMPVGLSSPVNAGAIEVDDCPRSYYGSDQAQLVHYDYISNFIKYLKAYNLRATDFVAFSYSGNVNDFWNHPESVDGVYQLLKAGNEIGWHCGQTHIPLDPAYWDGKAGVDNEVNAMAQATQKLRDKLQNNYGIQLPNVVSYVAPMECIGAYGYQSLDARSDVKYVGTSYARGSTQPQTENATYPVTYRDFGMEPGTNLYNLPRTQGSFFLFSRPESNKYYDSWAMLRCLIESGAPYVICTHPDENKMLGPEGYDNVTMAQVFQAYTTWADYVATNYPFYRWLTAGQLGQVCESRSGYLNARWLPGQKTLEINNVGQSEALQAKTSLYLSNCSKTDNTLRLTFSETPTEFQSQDYDIVKTRTNYFLYPPGSTESLAVLPGTPFQFPNLPPVLNPIGNKTVTVGNPISFNVAATDPNGDNLTFSASNLPAGASFNPKTRTFSWTPISAGVYLNVHFEVSDGSLTDSENITISVTEASTTTTAIRSSANPSVCGQSVTFTATVSGTGATGTVTFRDGDDILGSATLSGGTAIYSTSTLSVGSHTITAIYSGDTRFAGSTSSSLAQTITQAGSTIIISSSANPSAWGQSVTFTATVSVTGATGSVTFKDGDDTLGSAILSGGTATYSTSTLSVGSHTITAIYSGDACFAGSTSSSLAQTITQADSTTTISSSANPSAWGQSVTFTATVSGTGATGTVTFKDGDNTLGSAILSGGTATYSTSTLSVGSHTITAIYSGDTCFAGSTSPSLAQTITQAGSTTTISSSANPSVWGQSVTFTATVSGTGATGSVIFKDGDDILGSATLSNGTATYSTSTLSVGSHTITAIYSGDTRFAGSTSSSLAQTITQVSSTITISSSAIPSVWGQSVTFTATVSDTGATGTVIFKDGDDILGSATLSNGTATYSTSTLSAGSHTITAIYSGDTCFAGSPSSSLDQTITQADSTSSSGTKWGLIGGIAAAIAVFALISSVMIIRAKRR